MHNTVVILFHSTIFIIENLMKTLFLMIKDFFTFLYFCFDLRSKSTKKICEWEGITISLYFGEAYLKSDIFHDEIKDPVCLYNNGEKYRNNTYFFIIEKTPKLCFKNFANRFPRKISSSEFNEESDFFNYVDYHPDVFHQYSRGRIYNPELVQRKEYLVYFNLLDALTATCFMEKIVNQNLFEKYKDHPNVILSLLDFLNSFNLSFDSNEFQVMPDWAQEYLKNKAILQ